MATKQNTKHPGSRTVGKTASRIKPYSIDSHPLAGIDKDVDIPDSVHNDSRIARLERMTKGSMEVFAKDVWIDGEAITDFEGDINMALRRLNGTMGAAITRAKKRSGGTFSMVTAAQLLTAPWRVSVMCIVTRTA